MSTLILFIETNKQFSYRHEKVGLMKTVDSVVDEIFRVTMRDILQRRAAAEV